MEKTFVCPERLSVKDASDLRRQFLDLFEGAKALHLDMTKLERADAAVMQVFIAAVKEGKKRKVSVTFKNISPSVRKQMVLCGMLK